MDMKKTFALLMALTAALSMSATTLFFHPNENWRKDNARFAVYNVETQKWADLAPVQGEKNIFSAVVEEYATKVIFYRMDPAKKENTLANKWNETNELTLELNKNLYIMDEGAWDKGGGYWSRFEATPAEGSLYLWNGIGSTFKATEKGGDSFVLKTDERVLIGAGMMGNSCLKINGDYTNGYYIGIVLKEGGVNAGDTICLGDFRTDNSGTYRFGIEFFANVDATTPQGKFLTTTDPQVLNQEGAPQQAIYIVPNGVQNATHLRLFRNSGTECIWIAKLELIKKGSAPDPGPGPEPQPEDKSGYFIVGNHTDWQIDADYKLVANPAQEGEYIFEMFLTTESLIKVVYSEDGQNIKTWFPAGEGNAYGEHGEITENAAYLIYFRPEGGQEGWFAGCIRVEALEPTPQDPTVTVIGSMTEWLAEIPFTLSEDKKTAVLQVEKLSLGNYEFKLKINGEWRSNGYTFHREFTHADGVTMNDDNNMLLQADVTGKYTFIWTFETNSIDIVFPAKDPDPQPVDKSGYYIVGNHTDWQIDADYKFEANPAQEGEYVAKMFLSPEYIIKVVYSEDGENIKTWFPEGEGNAYGEHGEITESNGYTIYFRPNYDGGEDWFAGCLYVVVDQDQAIEDLNASEKAIKVIRNGQIIILKGDKAFNILGSQID